MAPPSEQYFLLVVISLMFIMATSIDPVYVRMMNFGQSKVWIHCKSKGGDLGLQVVEPTFYYDILIAPKQLGNEPIYCTFGREKTSHHFDIYKQDRDGACKRCIWTITEQKPCRLANQHTPRDTCYKWDT
ncbi:hypothetical protein ACFE04_005920 [Oxalis oulophora]